MRAHHNNRRSGFSNRPWLSDIAISVHVHREPAWELTPRIALGSLSSSNNGMKTVAVNSISSDGCGRSGVGTTLSPWFTTKSSRNTRCCGRRVSAPRRSHRACESGKKLSGATLPGYAFTQGTVVLGALHGSHLPVLSEPFEVTERFTDFPINLKGNYYLLRSHQSAVVRIRELRTDN